MPAVVYPLNLSSSEDLDSVIKRIGADPRAAAYVRPKRRTRSLYAKDVDFRASAYMKQELLARGGDAVVSRRVIDASAEKSDVLLLGTDGQLNSLVKKMEAMDCWGLRALREELARVMKNAAPEGANAWALSLPGGRELRLDDRTKIMGILNLTTDSFHTASRVKDIDDLLSRAAAMLADGADILDVGAESTRPGSTPLPEEEELNRLIPALKALRESFPDAVLSADTYKGRVALAAAGSGADIVNDIGGFGLDPDMLPRAAETGLPYVLSHIKGTPADMRNVPPYDDLLTEIVRYFHLKIEEAEKGGLPRNRLILDPGLGFGKEARDNLLLVREIESLGVFGLPILVGYSRKRFTGAAAATEGVENRLFGTAALSALMEGRVQITRVHDIRENREALLTARAVRKAPRWNSPK
ncbi:MAG: dihydropteroate synthase [Synergistaceae bacterium]|jgi:dihydropteroate synthase|nr:dihydropteroate synthase [Synergistaceae bacterium]